MWLKARCELAYRLQQPTPFLFMLRPRSSPRQWIAQETYKISPITFVAEENDKYGNFCQRIVAPAGEFSLSTEAVVMTSAAAEVNLYAEFISVPDLPGTVMEFLLPSRYCESDLLNAKTLEIVAGSTLGYQQVEQICRWIRQEIAYVPGSSNNPISSIDIMRKGEGVCRDLAHVGIALCRSICIPARMVVGYLHGLQPMDIHAWFEAYVGGEWYTFDPTQTSLQGGRVSIAHGRDAADVAISNQYGPSAYPHHMFVDVQEIDEP